MGNRLTPEERDRRIAILHQCLREGFHPIGEGGGRGSAVNEAARRIGVNSGGFVRSIEAADGVIDWQQYRPPQNLRESVPDNDGFVRVLKADVEERERDMRRLSDSIRRLQSELRQARSEQIDAHAVREFAFDLKAVPPSPPDWLSQIPVETHTPGVPVTVWSDWHWAEVVRGVEVAGVNQFSTEIAKARVRRLVERTVDLCFNHMVNPKYPGIVVCLGGDMMTGEIHPELAETNDQRVPPSLLDLQDVIAWGLRELKKRFGRVFVAGVVGNHGRGTLKPRAKGRVHMSFEWLVYCQLERYFESDPDIRFLIPGETDAHFSVYGHRFLLTHGDALGVKGGDGIIGALGPIIRGSIKVHNSERQIGRDFDTIVMGHWHYYLPLPGCIVNGSLKGYDEYARTFLRASFQPPIQALWFVHPKNGLTFHTPILLEDPLRAGDSRSWVQWAA